MLSTLTPHENEPATKDIAGDPSAATIVGSYAISYAATRNGWPEKDHQEYNFSIAESGTPGVYQGSLALGVVEGVLLQSTMLLLSADQSVPVADGEGMVNPGKLTAAAAEGETCYQPFPAEINFTDTECTKFTGRMTIYFIGDVKFVGRRLADGELVSVGGDWND